MAQEDNSCTVPINHNNTAQETSKTILKNGLNKNTTECVTAANAVYHARLWVKDNPDVWEKWKRIAKEEVQHKRRFGIQWLAEESRKKDQVDSEGRPFKINNTLTPALARLLVADLPEVRPYIQLRKSKADYVSMPKETERF